MKDFLYVLGIFACFTVPCAIAGLWYWVFLGAGMAILTGILELVAVIKTGKTLSKQFTEFVKETKWGFMVALSMSVGWVLLIIHLIYGIPK